MIVIINFSAHLKDLVACKLKCTIIQFYDVAQKLAQKSADFK